MADQGTPPSRDRTQIRRLREALEAVKALDDYLHRDWHTPENKRVRFACDDAILTIKFADGTVNPQIVAKPIQAAARKDEDYVSAFARIGTAVDAFKSYLMAFDETRSRDKAVEQLEHCADTLRNELDGAVQAFAVVVDRSADDPNLVTQCRDARRFAREIKNTVATRKIIRESQDIIREETRDVQDQTKKMAKEVLGDIAAGSLGHHYKTFADKEARRADLLRLIVAGLLTLLAAGAIWLYVWLGAPSLSAELVRLSATIPVAALAAYFASEASKHRATASWADELAIAMHTLPVYLEPLGEQQRIELRLALGMRAFGHSRNQPPDGAPWENSAGGNVALLQAFHEMAVRRGSGT